MREKTIEAALVKKVKLAGGEAYKFTSPGRANVPDRLCLFQVAPQDALTVAKYVKFVECKAPGKRPRAGQVREFERLRKMGFTVVEIDSK